MNPFAHEEDLPGLAIEVLIDMGDGSHNTYIGTLVSRGPYGLAMVTIDQRPLFFGWGHLISVELFEEEKL